MAPAPEPVDPLENWFDFRVQLLWAYDGPLEKWRSCALETDAIAAWLLRKGSVTLTYKGGTEIHGPGRWIFPRAEDGWQDFSEDTEILSIRFAAEWPTGQSLFDRSRTLSIPAEQLPHMTRIAQRLARLVAVSYPGVKEELRRMPGTPEKYFELQRLLYGWMLEYTTAMKKQKLDPHVLAQIDSRVRIAIHLMEMRSLSQPLREQELAKNAGLSTSQLNRLFVRQMGKTPADYWEEKRINSARLALLRSDQNIKSIAFDLGFSSLPHFSTWIKKKFGKSPRDLRLDSELRQLSQSEARQVLKRKKSPSK